MSGALPESLSGRDWANDLPSARREIAQLHGMMSRLHAALRLSGEGLSGRLAALNDFCAARESVQLALRPLQKQPLVCEDD